jgi:transposase
MDLTAAQWVVLEPLFRPNGRADGRGQPWRDARSVLNGVLWILRTGAQWRELPSKYPELWQIVAKRRVKGDEEGAVVLSPLVRTY